MDYVERIITDIETHDVEAIIECFQNGVSPNSLFRGEPLLHELISEYGRGSSFKSCVQAFVDYGLVYPQPAVLAVLLDDAVTLQSLISAEPGLVSRRFDLRCAYTPLMQSTLLHICAEFNHVNCARVLVQLGAAINAMAGCDQDGCGGQTPIFHTVNQNQNRSLEMLDFLLENKADLGHSVQALVWGQGYPWETLIPAVNPISYAMMGLLPQMHRDPATIAMVVQRLLQVQFGKHIPIRNVPNAYLNS